MPSHLEQAPQPDPLACGATAVITHRVRPGHADAYERWISEIRPVTESYPGYLDIHIIRPVPDLTHTYVVVLRFRQQADLERWLKSDDRHRFIDRVRPILDDDDRFFLRTGLDFWFTPRGAKALLPVRWKQALITWSAIFPLVLFVPMILLPPLHAIGLPAFRPLDTLITTACLVCLMVYVIMPRYTRLVSRWLFA
ncbi:MAG: antibiotic biosynthesis monooxygenase [Planctomycetota bacterium]